MSVPAPGLTAAVGTPLGEPCVTEADLIAAAVLASPDVVGLHGGRFGEVATYLPGRRIVGVRLRLDDTLAGIFPAAVVVEVHVIARYPAGVADLDASVRAAVHTALGLHRDPVRVSIVIGDIVADQPAIGGPVGDRPVLDTPPAVRTPASTPPSEPPHEPADATPAATTSAPPASPADSAVADPAAVDAVAPVVRVVTERVVTERVVTEDAVTDRITVEHAVVGRDHDDDPVARAGVELDGAGGRVSGRAAVEGRSASEQENQSW